MNGFRDKERANQTQRDSTVVTQHRETSATQSTNSASIETETETTENGFTSTSTNGSFNATSGGIGEDARSLVPIGTDGLQFMFGGAAFNHLGAPGAANDIFSDADGDLANWGQSGYSDSSTQYVDPGNPGSPSTNHLNAGLIYRTWSMRAQSG